MRALHDRTIPGHNKEFELASFHEGTRPFVWTPSLPTEQSIYLVMEDGSIYSGETTSFPDSPRQDSDRVSRSSSHRREDPTTHEPNAGGYCRNFGEDWHQSHFSSPEQVLYRVLTAIEASCQKLSLPLFLGITLYRGPRC